MRSGDGETIGVGAVVADLTERTRAQLRLAAQYQVTRILSTAESFDEATPELLAALCENLGWAVAGIWAVDDERGTARMLDAYCADDFDGAAFVEAGRALELERGVRRCRAACGRAQKRCGSPISPATGTSHA